MKIATEREFLGGIIQFLVGATIGWGFATLYPGYPYGIVTAAMIPVIIFVWPFIKVRLVEHGWIKP